MKNLAKETPMAKVFYVGSSYEGREQLAIKVKLLLYSIESFSFEGVVVLYLKICFEMLQLKGRSSPKKPVFFINCGIHAREWVSPATCIYMIKQVCDCL